MNKYLQIKKITVALLVVMLLVPILSIEGVEAKPVTTKPGKPTSFKATVTMENGVKLAWKKAKKAKKYQIYRSDKKNGKYTKIKTTSARKYTDSSCLAGKTYFYKVRAYRMNKKKKVYGTFSVARKVKIKEDLTLKPMTRVSEMPEGTNVSFVQGVNTNIRSSNDKYNFYAAIASSYTELKEIFNCDYNPNGYNYIAKYNESFFEDKSVIVIFTRRANGSIKQSVNSLVKKGDELCIGMSVSVPGEGYMVTCDIGFWRTILEVKKTDIAGITKVSIFEKQGTQML